MTGCQSIERDPVIAAITYNIRIVEDSLTCANGRWLKLPSLKSSPFKRASDGAAALSSCGIPI